MARAPGSRRPLAPASRRAGCCATCGCIRRTSPRPRPRGPALRIDAHPRWRSRSL